MEIGILGANGQIGRLFVEKAVAAGHQARAVVRDDAQRADLESLGAKVVLGDLEGEFESALTGCDAILFTAGSGGKTGGDKTLLVDLWGAVRSYEACSRLGIRRYVMVSALKADAPLRGPERIRHYLVAKHIADDYLQRQSLDWTIVRPGRLLNEPGTGRIDTSFRSADQAASIPREDVAVTLLACLEAPHTVGKVFDLASGDQPIADAVAALK